MQALVDEWHALDGTIEPMMQGPGALMFGDVRGARARPAARRWIAPTTRRWRSTRSSRSRWSPSADCRCVRQGLGALVVEHDGSDVAQSRRRCRVGHCTSNPGRPCAALYSRRTAEELRALPGDGDAEPYLTLIAAHLPLPERSLGE